MATKKDGKTQKGLIVQTLIVKPNNRSTSDIDAWRTALKAADKGKRAKLYDLYEDLLLDNILSSAIDKRVMAITNADISFMRNDESVPEMETLIDSPEFEDIIKEIILSKLWGKSVIELDFSQELVKPYSIPRRNLRVDKGIIVVNETDEEGIPYKDDDFFLEAGNDDDLGLILKAAPFCIYKRGGFGDYAQYVEIFGIPQRVGKYNSNDDATRKILLEMFEQAGSAPYVVIPKEADVETNTTNQSTGVKLHKDFIDACNEEILIGILGQTMTTQDGSSKSQSETHKEGEEGINKSDRRFVQRILNRVLLPRLEKRGYPVTGGFFYFPEAGENLTTTERLEIDRTLKMDIGLPIDDEYFYETYSVPKPKGNVSSKKPTEKPPVETKQSDSSTSTVNYQLSTILERLLSFFVLAPEKGANSSNLSSKITCCPECNGIHQHGSGISPFFKGESGEAGRGFNLAFSDTDFDEDAFLKRIASGECTYFDPELFTYTSSVIRQGLASGFIKKNFASLGVEYGFEPDALKTAMEVNIFQFSAAKNLVEVQKLNELFRSSKGYDDFYTKAKSVTTIFNKTWLQTEFDTADLTAESSAAYHRLASQTDIFPYWEYRTVGDDRVRPEHSKLRGLILPANDPRWNSIYPPNGWKCRCYIVPRMKHEVEGIDFKANRAMVDEYFKTTEWKKNASQGFDVNRAILGQIFTKNQMYINKFPDKAGKLLKNLFYNDWWLDEIGKRMALATEDLKVYSGEAKEWFKTNSKDGFVSFKDYQNREVKLSEKTFDFHTTKKSYSDRAGYLDSIKEIIANPDEVWLNDYIKGKYDNFILIKYYKDNAIAVICRVNDGKIYEVNTWFRIAVESKVKDKLQNPRWMYRRGLLIKNKK